MSQVEAPIEISSDVIADFCRRHRISRLALFGSVLRDDFGPESDVDVLVEFEPDAEVGFMALGRIQWELAELLQLLVDLVPQMGLKPLIRESVLASSRELYTVTTLKRLKYCSHPFIRFYLLPSA